MAAIDNPLCDTCGSRHALIECPVLGKPDQIRKNQQASREAIMLRRLERGWPIAVGNGHAHREIRGGSAEAGVMLKAARRSDAVILRAAELAADLRKQYRWA